MGAKLNRCIWRDCGFKYNNYSDKELKNLEAYLKEKIKDRYEYDFPSFSEEEKNLDKEAPSSEKKLTSMKTDEGLKTKKKLKLLINEETLNVKITSSTYEGLESPKFEKNYDQEQKNMDGLNSKQLSYEDFQHVHSKNKYEDSSEDSKKENISIYSNIENHPNNELYSRNKQKYSLDGKTSKIRQNSHLFYARPNIQTRESASAENLTKKENKVGKDEIFREKMKNVRFDMGNLATSKMLESSEFNGRNSNFKKLLNNEKDSIKRAQMQLSSNDKVFQNKIFDGVYMNSPMMMSKEYGDIFTDSDFSSPMKEKKICDFNFMERRKKNLSEV